MNQINSKKTIVSGMRPTGLLHLGHYFGVIKNWLDLQNDYMCYFFVANWHSLTTEYTRPQVIADSQYTMVVDWLASGIDPEKAVIFIQSDVSAHAELHVLLSMISPLGWLERVPSYKELQLELKDKDLATYGFLGYPVLQTADVAIYKGDLVPVGQDQVAHIELSREIIRRFHHLYKKEIFPEPKPLLTKASKLLGLDGRKMSKSYDNSIYLSDSPEVMAQKFKTCLTDPARQRRTDPGNPEVCPVYDYHKLVTPADKLAEINAECRSAGIGCIDCKKILSSNVTLQLASYTEKRQEIAANPDYVKDVVHQGKIKASQKANQTLTEVKSIMGLPV
jgi:tryptophanyl-tRNA synthetase